MATAPDIVFPGNLASVALVNNLRALDSEFLVNATPIIVGGAVTIGDGNGGVFIWDASSLAADDGISVIRPNDRTPLQAGRWIASPNVSSQISGQLAAFYAQLASDTGSTLVGWKQAGTGATSRSVYDKLRERYSALDFGAVGDGVTDDTAAISLALAAIPVTGKLFLPQGRTFRVSALANTRSIGFEGGGQIVVGLGNATYSVVDYARDKGFIVGRENNFRMVQRANIDGTVMTGYLAGDSTVARGNGSITGSISGNTLTVTAANGFTLVPGTILTSVSGTPTILSQTGGTTFGNGTYTISASLTLASTTINVGNGGGFAGAAGEPQELLSTHFRLNNVRNTLNITNLGVGGTNWSQCNVIPYLGVATDFVVLKYGINHVSGQDLQAEINAMRTCLANIRAQTYGRVDLLTIVLVGPNSTFDQAAGRTSYWYERLRYAYEQAARDYKCVYVDLYGMYQDSTWWGNVYADNPPVHPGALLQQQLWAQVAEAVFPRNGMIQSVTPKFVDMAGLNGWVNFATNATPMSVSLSADGWVDIRGRIKSGAVGDAGAVANLPNTRYYPPTTAGPFICSTYDGTAYGRCQFIVEVDGRILQAGGDAKASAYTCLDGIRYRVW